MSNHLVRITKNDYKDFRRAFVNVTYSMGRNDFSQKILLPKQTPYISCVLGKGEFLDQIEKPENEFYFFKDSNEQIIGILLMIFNNRTCKISEFAVFEQNKGLGTELYNLALEIMKEKYIKLIELWCPFPGAQEFWKKLGFTKKFDDKFSFEKVVKFRFKK